MHHSNCKNFFSKAKKTPRHTTAGETNVKREILMWFTITNEIS